MYTVATEIFTRQGKSFFFPTLQTTTK